MSTNGWGKGSVNNSNGWGAGAINNDNGWGDSHLKSWSGDTDIDGGTGIPVNTVAPVISGTTTLGSVLTVTTGTWTAKPSATYTYQWKRNGLDIVGATNSSYTIVNDDGATNIFCKVTATNEFGFASANSNTLPIPAFTDADAQAFITAASITNPTQQSAINTLVTDLKGYGIWSKMKAIYPFVGGTASSHKFNLKDPRDLDAAFRLVFSGGITHSVNGVDPNGINGLGDTKMTSASLGTSSFAMWYYSRENIATNTLFGNANKLFWQPKVNNGYWYAALNSAVNLDNLPSDFPSSFSGFLGVNTLSSTNSKFFRNGTSYKTLPTLGSRGTEAGNITLFYRNLVAQPTSNECSLSAITDGLTDTEAANFYTAVQSFQTTLSRQV